MSLLKAVAEDVGVEIIITKKKMKNLRLRVLPPDGTVRVSIPYHVKEPELLNFIYANKDWIEAQVKRVRARRQVNDQKMCDGGEHLLWGKALSLQIVEANKKPSVVVSDTALVMSLRQGADLDMRQKLLDDFYREEMRRALPPLIDKWQAILGVNVKYWNVKKMRTLWGSCNIQRQRIWFNLALAGKPASSIEYVVVHELLHLIERYHNQRFWGLMDHYLPNWRIGSQILDESVLF
ncbi:MAG: metal-dependent hydrolase [Alteromonadaceae bacterium]|nr:MAG: metal-dependent hydrolase [Alteromonadaceae bacterium]